MAMLDLDKIINITTWGGGGGGIYPWGDNPVPYPVVQQKIGVFNKPNAWDVDSNGLSGSWTTPRTTTASATYIDLSLTTS